MEEKKIIKKLLDEGCPTFMISNTTEKIKSMNEDLKTAFFNWCNNGQTPDIAVEGFSFESLVKDYKMNPIGAFLTLDWLCREPEKAIKNLKRGIK